MKKEEAVLKGPPQLFLRGREETTSPLPSSRPGVSISMTTFITYGRPGVLWYRNRCSNQFSTGTWIQMNRRKSTNSLLSNMERKENLGCPSPFRVPEARPRRDFATVDPVARKKGRRKLLSAQGFCLVCPGSSGSTWLAGLPAPLVS